MSWHGWSVFAAFWLVFVTTPGPNAVNCISNGMHLGFMRALWGVAGILTQASLFLILSALGVTALIAASPALYGWIRMAGALVLVGLGLRALFHAGQPLGLRATAARSVYGRALMIATLNVKSVTGYLAAFTQFIQPDTPIWGQMSAIFPTALCLTALSYSSYTAIGALMGRAALGMVLNLWFGRAMGVAFILYGLALGFGGAALANR